MKISIITPSFNQAQFLEQALDSIWQQVGDFELEHIVADGGSTDGSVEILKQYAERLERGDFTPRCKKLTFQWWSGPDKGQSDALNQGFQKATGDVFGWINSDDFFASDTALQRVREAFLESGADLVVGNARHVDDEGERVDLPTLVNTLSNADFQQALPRLKRFDFIIQPSCLFRREVWDQLGIQNHYHYVMDWDLWLRALDADFRFIKIDIELGCNRLHEGAKTVVGGERKFEEALELFRLNKCWCPNRFYHYIYWLLLRAQRVPWVAPVIEPLIRSGKTIRNSLVQRFRLY